MLVQDDLRSMDHSMSNKSVARSPRRKQGKFYPEWQQPLAIQTSNYASFFLHRSFGKLCFFLLETLLKQFSLTLVIDLIKSVSLRSLRAYTTIPESAEGLTS